MLAKGYWNSYSYEVATNEGSVHRTKLRQVTSHSFQEGFGYKIDTKQIQHIFLVNRVQFERRSFQLDVPQTLHDRSR